VAARSVLATRIVGGQKIEPTDRQVDDGMFPVISSKQAAVV
jgi:hypothetical protein